MMRRNALRTLAAAGLLLLTPIAARAEFRRIEITIYGMD
jgi:hypothetical protein